MQTSDCSWRSTPFPCISATVRHKTYRQPLAIISPLAGISSNTEVKAHICQDGIFDLLEFYQNALVVQIGALEIGNNGQTLNFPVLIYQVTERCPSAFPSVLDECLEMTRLTEGTLEPRNFQQKGLFRRDIGPIMVSAMTSRFAGMNTRIRSTMGSMSTECEIATAGDLVTYN